MRNRRRLERLLIWRSRPINYVDRFSIYVTCLTDRFTVSRQLKNGVLSNSACRCSAPSAWLPTEEYSSRILKALQLTEHQLEVLEHGADKIVEVVDEQYQLVTQIQNAESEERDRNFAKLVRFARKESERLKPQK